MKRWLVVVLTLVTLSALPTRTLAQLAETPDFGSLGMSELWLETEYPVVTGVARRSFFYGPTILLRCQEPYEEGANGTRPVVYLDKARLEETSPNSISSGLLAKELITGRRQMGDNAFVAHQPADVPVAGDVGASTSPTYASFAGVATIADPTVNRAPRRIGQMVTQTIDQAGTVGEDPSLARYGVRLADYREELGHNMADVFVTFVQRSGLVAQHNVTGQVVYWERSPLLIEWTDTLGFPVAEPYWAQAPVGGQVTWVLIQAFERRVLTYTPDNDPAFQVEMGNIGLHYKIWRHPDGTCRE